MKRQISTRRAGNSTLACLISELKERDQEIDFVDAKSIWNQAFHGDTLAAAKVVAQRNGYVCNIKKSLDDLILRRGDILIGSRQVWRIVAIEAGTYKVYCPDSDEIASCAKSELPSFSSVLRLEKGEASREARPTYSIANFLRHASGVSKPIAKILIVTLAIQLLSLVNPLFFQLAIDEVAISRDLQFLFFLVGGYICVTAIGTLLGLLRADQISSLDLEIRGTLSRKFFRGLIATPYAALSRKPINDYATKLGSLSSVQGFLGAKSIEVLVDGVLSLAALMLMVVYSWKLAIIPAISLFLYSAAKAYQLPKIRRLSKEAIHHATQQAGILIETLRSILPLKAAERGATRYRHWADAQLVSDESIKETTLHAMRGRILQQAITSSEYIAVIATGVVEIVDNRLTIGMLVAFQFYRNLFQSKAHSLIDQWFERTAISTHIERIHDVFEQAESYSEPVERSSYAKGNIEVCNVKFRFTESSPWILYDACLKVGAGKVIGISAPSGYGKSTFVKVLIGLLDCNAGEVKFDGKAMSSENGSGIRNAIAVAFQEDFILQATIEENIAFFSPIDEGSIKRCAEAVGLADEISTFVGGYKTPIGDGAQSLSGGQKQRLIIARALYKDPDILILDEATTALDRENEQRVLDAISALSCTRIVISHNPRMLQICDEVYEIRNGKFELIENTSVMLRRAGG